MGHTNFVDPTPTATGSPFPSVLSEFPRRTEAENLELIFFWPLRSQCSAVCTAAAKSMRILLLIAPKDYGGGGKLSGGGGRGQDPSVGQDPGRPVGREHGNGMGCCRQSRLTEEARAGGWSGRAGRQAGSGGNQQLPSQCLSPLSSPGLPSRFTTKTTL